MARDWSQFEVEAIVDDYLAMLALELRHESFNKAARRRAVLAMLDARSPQAVEFKHANISAVMLELGCPYVRGYKPRSNVQQLLRDVVAERLSRSAELADLLVRDAVSDAGSGTGPDAVLSEVSPPELPRVRTPNSTVLDSAHLPRKFDYLSLEAQNGRLGAAGESFVLEFERARLVRMKRPDLASRIEHVSCTQGDGLGFDIASFEVDGREKFIEVKTSKYGAHTPIFVSRREVEVSERIADAYAVYRVFDFRRSPRFFQLRGPIGANFALRPDTFVGTLK